MFKLAAKPIEPAGIRRSAVGFMLIPPGIMLGLGLLLVLPPTRDWGFLLLGENHLIELMSFAAAMWAAVEGVRLVRCLNGYYGLFVRGFLSLFAFMMFFLAMEEISWGQHFFKFATPEFWSAQNRQGELTLHNYNWVGVHYLEVYPLLFGVGGLIGIVLRSERLLPWVICPAVQLWPWFVTITLHCGIDLFHEFYIWSSGFDTLINALDEAAELLVACSGLLFLRLNRKDFIAQLDA